jgi:hypothetical protein
MIKHRGQYDAAPGLQLVQTSLLSQVYAVLSKVLSVLIISTKALTLSLSPLLYA